MADALVTYARWLKVNFTRALLTIRGRADQNLAVFLKTLDVSS